MLLANLIVLAYDEVTARHFGQLKAQLEQGGERISDMDLQIASIAIAYSIPLVTHNQGHFARLVNLADLALEDWLE